MAPSESSSVTCSRIDLATVGREADRNVVWLRGEHDVSTVSELSLSIARAVALDGADLVLDLSGVEFMGGATVDVIIRTRELLHAWSRDLVLRSPSRCAQRIVDICGLGDLVDPRPDEAMRVMASEGALSSWVEVPPTDRLDRPAASSPPTPGRAPDRASVNGITAAWTTSLVDSDSGVADR